MDLSNRGTKKTFRDNFFLKAFFLGLGLSFIIFIPFIVIDGGRFLFYGDFNVQQIPFYQVAHEAVRSGNLGWNQYTDLGVNFIGSYSFYLLGSPFFWLTIPFPVEWIQYLMGPLLILKFAFATLTAYIFLHRYVKNQNYALIGALLYAFSGFSVYNIFFNHFHEAIIVFPLLLAALDEYMYKKQRGLFALTVALCCLTNYYFFVGQVVFTLIYFIIRLACGSWKISVKDFFILVFEAVLGVLISAILLVPSVLAVMQNTRVTKLISGWDGLLYSSSQRYVHILQSLFFMPDLPARPNFTPDSNAKWASVAAWLPLFGMTGVIGWLQIRRKHWLKKLLWATFFMALVPVLNSFFQMMNNNFYTRWFYMLTLMMALATVMALEYEYVNWKRAIRWSAVFTCIIIFFVAFMPNLSTTVDGKRKISFGLMSYPWRFWAYAAVSLICIAAVVYLFQFSSRDKRKFVRNTLSMVCVTTVLYSLFFIALGKTQSSWPADHFIPEVLNGYNKVDVEGFRDDNVRNDFYESTDNIGMFWGAQTINAFHSIVPGSIMEFYKSIGVDRSVASRPETEHYPLRAITSVKWLFDEDWDDNDFADEDTGEPQMPGWLYNSNTNGFDVWENEYYIPIGYCYNYYIKRSDYDTLSDIDKELVMLKAVVLEDEDVDSTIGTLIELPENKKVFTKEAYFDDCTDRAKETCETFTYTRTGFTAEIKTELDRFVFFSVPAEDGWTATVNGESTKIFKSNVGFMGVMVPRGKKIIIDFKYVTPGLPQGVLITVVALIIFVGYMVMNYRAKKRRLASARDNTSNSYRKSMMSARKFDDYKDKTGATFMRDYSMVPKEFQVPDPVDYAAQSANLEQETSLKKSTIHKNTDIAETDDFTDALNTNGINHESENHIESPENNESENREE